MENGKWKMENGIKYFPLSVFNFPLDSKLPYQNYTNRNKRRA